MDKEMEILFNEINSFIQEVRSKDIYGKSKWFTNNYIELYLRVFNKGWIPYKGKGSFLVVATVGVDKFARRQGVFTSLLNYLEGNDNTEFLGVESVGDACVEIRKCLEKENFENIDNKNFFKKLKNISNNYLS